MASPSAGSTERRVLNDAGTDLGGWGDISRWHLHPLAVLRDGFYMMQVWIKVDGGIAADGILIRWQYREKSFPLRRSTWRWMGSSGWHLYPLAVLREGFYMMQVWT